MMAKICDRMTIDCQSSICGRKTMRSFLYNVSWWEALYFCSFFPVLFQNGVKLKAGIKVWAKRNRSFGAGKSKAVKGMLFFLYFLRAFALPFIVFLYCGMHVNSTFTSNKYTHSLTNRLDQHARKESCFVLPFWHFHRAPENTREPHHVTQ